MIRTTRRQATLQLSERKLCLLIEEALLADYKLFQTPGNKVVIKFITGTYMTSFGKSCATISRVDGMYTELKIPLWIEPHKVFLSLTIRFWNSLRMCYNKVCELSNVEYSQLKNLKNSHVEIVNLYLKC